MKWRNMANLKRMWRRRNAQFDERGDTLIEILLTITIMSLTTVALITAFSTSISASSEYRGLSVTDTVLRTVSEQVIGQFQEGTTFLPCDSAMDLASQYENAMKTTALLAPSPYKSANYVATISSVGFWNGAGFGTSCTPGSTAPQQITITLTGPFAVPQLVSFVVEGSGQIFSAPAIQLAAPTNVVPSTPTDGSSGALVVNFTGSSNAAALQYYTIKACTNSAMTLGCAPVADEFEPGNELQGLVPGTTYWVTVYANASPGFLASSSAEGGPGTTSGTLSQPYVNSVTPSTTTAGALVVTYSPESGAPTGETFTVTGCTNSSMLANCVSASNFTTGAQLTGLTPGTYYYVDVTAASDGVSSFAYTPPVMATVQLGTASSVSVSSSQTQTGALTVTFTGPANAPSGQAYSVTGCTNSAMTSGCVTQSSYTSGSQFTGLTSGMSYYVTVTALASNTPTTGYLASTSSPTAKSTEATTQLSQPVITNVAGNGSGKIKVTYNGSGNAPSGETYTLIGCTDAAMSLNCVTNSNYLSGHQQGTWTSGVTVYVTITANAAPGYLASVPSVQAKGTAG